MSDPMTRELARLKATIVAATEAQDSCPELEAAAKLSSQLLEHSPRLQQKWQKVSKRPRDEKAGIVKRDIRELLVQLGAKSDDPDEVAVWGVGQCDALLEMTSSSLNFLASTSYAAYLSSLDGIVNQICEQGYQVRLANYYAEFVRSTDFTTVEQFYADGAVEDIRWLNGGSRTFSNENVERFIALYGRFGNMYKKDLLFLHGLADTAAGNRTTYRYLMGQNRSIGQLVDYLKDSRHSIFATPWDTQLLEAGAGANIHVDAASSTVFAGGSMEGRPYPYAEVSTLAAEMVSAVLSCRLLPCLISKHNWSHFQEGARGKRQDDTREV